MKILKSLWGAFWLIIPPAMAIRSLIHAYKEDIVAGIGMFLFFGFLSLVISPWAYEFLQENWKNKHKTEREARPNDLVQLYHGPLVRRSTYERIMQKQSEQGSCLLWFVGTFILLALLSTSGVPVWVLVLILFVIIVLYFNQS